LRRSDGCPRGPVRFDEVNRVNLTVRRSLPVFPEKRTTSGSVAMSQTCQRIKSRSNRRAVIPADDSARLIALGYMADLEGRLRMTMTGRARIRKQATAKIKLGH
jgi:hypothetical protein